MIRSRARSGLAAALALLAAAVLAVATLGGTAAQAAPASQAASASTPLPPVASVDLARYLGRWYQVAAIPQPYQLQCARNSTAVYTAVDADTIGVRNTCSTWLGPLTDLLLGTVTGKADVLDPTTNAQLRVSFDGIPSFGDTSTPNYVITYLAPDYSFAIVGDPARQSGFVLSRTPALQGITWSQVRQIVEARGYDSCRFKVTPVAGGRQDRVRLCTL